MMSSSWFFALAIAATPAAAEKGSPPIAEPASFTVDEDGTLSDVLRAADADGDAVVFVLATPPKRGALQLDRKSGAFTYTPKPNANGEDSFKFWASDGKLVGSAVVTVTVNPVDDAPAFVGPALVLRVFEDGKAGGKVSARDVDGDALHFRVAGAPSHGEASVDARGQLSYAPAHDYAGDDAFALEVEANGVTAATDVRVVVVPINDAPVAAPLTVEGAEDQLLEGTVSGSDVESDPLSYRVATPPKRGSVKLDEKSGAFRYTPWKEAHGADSFTFVASDGKLVGTAAVSLTVAAVDDPPTLVGAPLSLKVDEDGQASLRVVARDVDGDALTFRIATPPGHGEASVDAAGLLRFAPTRDFAGEDSLTLEVEAAGASVSAEVKVAIAPVNDPPQASPAEASGVEDEPRTGTLAGSDVDGDALSYRLVTEPKRGAVTIDAKSGAFSYTPARDTHGDDSFTFAVSDGKLASSAAVALKVAPVDDPPSFVGAPFSLKTAEDAKGTARLAARDVDGDALTYRITRPPSQGEASVDAAGQLSYQPAPDRVGEDSFDVEVIAGSAAASASVNVVVTAVNDAPVGAASELTGPEDQALEGSVSGSDIDGDALSYRVQAPPRRGTLKLDEKSGAFRYTPWKDAHGEDSFVFAVSDGKVFGTATVSLKVAPVDDAPVIVGGPFALKTAEDAAATGKVSARDVDGDALTFRVGRAPAHGEASVDAAGKLSFIPTPDFHGTDSFTVEAEAAGALATAEVGVTVTPVQDPPKIDEGSIAELAEDTVHLGQLPAQDPDGDALTYRIVGAPRLGTATLEDAKTGAFRYTPRPNAHGDDEIKLEVTAGGQRVAGTARLRVTPQNDAPTLTVPASSTREDQPVELQLRGEDVDGDPLTYQIAKAPARGAAQMVDAAKGLLRVTPAKDDPGAVELEVVARDAVSSSAPARIVVQVQGENDAPVLTSMQIQTPEDVTITRKLTWRDADGDALTFKVGEASALGEVRIASEHDGTFSFSPRKNASGTGVFTLVATDPQGAVARASVTVIVTPVDDPPVAVGTRELASKVGRMSGRLAGHDPEGTRVRFRLASQPSLGEVELIDEQTGDYVFTTAGRGAGQTVFTFVVIDASGLVSAPGRVEVLVR